MPRLTETLAKILCWLGLHDYQVTVGVSAPNVCDIRCIRCGRQEPW